MIVNGHEYFSVDFDTVTIAADYPTSFCEGLVPIPEKCIGYDPWTGSNRNHVIK